MFALAIFGIPFFVIERCPQNENPHETLPATVKTNSRLSPAPHHGDIAMRKLLLLALMACFVSEQALRAASPAAAAKHYTACTLMTLQDAKSLIGADAELQQGSSTDDHCYYRSSGGATYLHINASAAGHTWTDYKAEGKQVKGVGDEAYFYPAKNPLGNTLMVRKGDVVIMINARSDGLSDENIQGKELAFSRKMATRL